MKLFCFPGFCLDVFLFKVFSSQFYYFLCSHCSLRCCLFPLFILLLFLPLSPDIGLEKFKIIFSKSTKYDTLPSLQKQENNKLCYKWSLIVRKLTIRLIKPATKFDVIIRIIKIIPCMLCNILIDNYWIRLSKLDRKNYN